jgi:hypothetical protein
VKPLGFLGVALAGLGTILLLTRKKALPEGELPPEGRVAPSGGWGDVDGDGYVTEKDAILVQEYLVGTTVLTDEQLRRADVDGNGRISAVDALIIRQYATGQIDTFPVEKVPPLEVWQYGQPSGTLTSSPTPNMWFVSLACEVTNPGPVAATKAIKLYINTGPVDANLQNTEPYKAIKTRTVTIGARESFTFVSEGDILVTWEQMQSRLNPYYAQAFLGFPLYLQDSDGTQSPIATIF